MSLGMLEILRGGGFTTGGLMFDTKLRRQSIARDDLFHGHIGAMDVMARSLLVAASLIDDLDARRDARYARWNDRTDILDGNVTLQQLHDTQLTAPEPVGVSGRQELLENLVNRHIDQTH